MVSDLVGRIILVVAVFAIATLICWWIKIRQDRNHAFWAACFHEENLAAIAEMNAIKINNVNWGRDGF